MLSCKEVTEFAAAHAEGVLPGEERAMFVAHVSTCPACQTWLRQLSAASAAVRALPPPVLPGELQEQLLRSFDGWQAARTGQLAHTRQPSEAGGRFVWEALVAIVGVVALLAGMARSPSRAMADWATAAGLAVAAMMIALLARRLTLRFAVAAVSAALVAAALRGGTGRLEPAEGIECLVLEVLAAGAIGGAGWLAARRKEGSFQLGPWFVAGSLAGAAALQVACGSHSSLPHLLVFHSGGVVLVAALAMALRSPLVD